MLRKSEDKMFDSYHFGACTGYVARVFFFLPTHYLPVGQYDNNNVLQVFKLTGIPGFIVYLFLANHDTGDCHAGVGNCHKLSNNVTLIRLYCPCNGPVADVYGVNYLIQWATQ